MRAARGRNFYVWVQQRLIIPVFSISFFFSVTDDKGKNTNYQSESKADDQTLSIGAHGNLLTNPRELAKRRKGFFLIFCLDRSNNFYMTII